ncbi:MAG: iron-siderophore ABC transporter substrate-binding protein [Brachybacterium sp.]|nr:iron-siderophore ABC transporter substrate-binding protein [Brachybacterium sp.]
MSLTPRPTPTSTGLGRRAVLGAGTAAGIGAVLAACSTGPAGDTGSGDTGSGEGGDAEPAEGAYPRTITHALGETTLETAPERIATISWVNPDTVLALGIVPVGMDAVTWGGNENQSTDWIDAKVEELGGQTPALFSTTDGLDTDAIAASTPDLIVAAYSGLDQEQYDALTAIAPTIAYPEGSGPWSTSWQDSLTLVGEALAQEDEAQRVIEDVESQMQAVAEENPSLEGTTFLFATLDPAAADQISLYTDADNRPKFLETLGMQNAPVVQENAGDDGAFFITWSPERADELESDLLVAWFNDEAALETVLADPLLSRIPAIENDHFLPQTDQMQALSISAASALSIPWALETVMPQIIEVADSASAE